MKPVLLKTTKAMLFIGLVALCFLAFLCQLHFPDSSKNFLGETKRIELSPNGPVTQVFIADRNGLEGFQIFMGDTDLSLNERIDFTLFDSSCRNTLSQSGQTFLSPQIMRDIRFMFPALPNSRDEAYCLSIKYHPGWMKRKERPYIRVTENEQSREDSYTDHGKQKTYNGRTLQVRPIYTPENASFSGRFMELENRLSQYKPAFVKGYMLPIGLLVIILGLGFFTWISRQKN